jgi:hypothetical protein
LTGSAGLGGTAAALTPEETALMSSAAVPGAEIAGLGAAAAPAAAEAVAPIAAGIGDAAATAGTAAAGAAGASTISDLLPFLLVAKNGGRINKDDGGALSDDSSDNLNPIPLFENMPLNGMSNPNAIRDAVAHAHIDGLQNLGASVRPDMAGNVSPASLGTPPASIIDNAIAPDVKAVDQAPIVQNASPIPTSADIKMSNQDRDLANVPVPTADQFNKQPDVAPLPPVRPADLGTAPATVPVPPVRPAGLVAAPPATSSNDINWNDPKQAEAYYRAGAAARGYDPDVVANMFKQESSFRVNNPGDKNSSFNIPQLHKGNINSQFPHSGLADDFQKQTGLDPADTANSKAVADWTLDNLGKTGWSPWANSRDKLGYSNFTGLNTGNASSVANIPAKGAVNAVPATLGTATTSDQSSGLGAGAVTTDQASGLGGSLSDMWNDPSKRNIALAIMSGIGKMASSNSRFFGGALLQGVGGGAEAYQQGLANNANIMKNTLGMAGQRYTVSYDGNGNQHIYDSVLAKEVSPQERIAGINAMSNATGGGNIFNSMGQPSQPDLKSTISQPVAAGVGANAGANAAPVNAAPAPAAATAAPAVTSKNAGEPIAEDGTIKDKQTIQAEMLNDKNRWSNLPTELRPDTQIAQYKQYTEAAQKDEAIAAQNQGKGPQAQEIANAAVTRANSERAQAQASYEKAQKTLENASTAQATASENAAARRNSYLADAQDFNTSIPREREKTLEAAALFQNAQAGPSLETKTQLATFAQKYGIPLPANWELAKTPEQFAAITKDAIGSAFQQAKDSGANKAPATALKEAILTTPQASTPGGAVYKILSDRLAALDYAKNMNDYILTNGNKDVQFQQNKFQKEHSFSDQLENARDEVPVPKGTTTEDLKGLGINRGVDPETGKALRMLSPEEAAKLPPKTRFMANDGTNRIFVR